ncbi:YggU family protein [Candidatus Woesearchaeota archaeon]|nr:YggU family protein [Candidatus Woesearchaeota archaeon]
MDLHKHIFNNIIKVKISPNSSQNKIKEENELLKVYVKAPLEKGKANGELIRFFKKELKLQVIIISGEKARTKLLKVL